MNEKGSPLTEGPQDHTTGLPASALAPFRESLLKHPLYDLLGSLGALRILMREHVFAIWDFMSLLKALRRALTCVEVPRLARQLNEIELDGDEHGALGREMADLLCTGDPALQREAHAAAATALRTRIVLWDGIGKQVEETGSRAA